MSFDTTESDCGHGVDDPHTHTPPEPSSGVIAYVAESYPGVMTFLEREIAALVRQGWDVTVCSLRGPAEIRYAAEAARYPVRVEYCLNRHLFTARMARVHLGLLRNRPRAYFSALRFALQFARDSWYSFSRVTYAFLKSGYFCEVARARGVQHLHAHFAGRTTEVAMFMAQFLDISFSFTGHSNDVTGDYPLLREKIERADFVAAENQRAAQAISARLQTAFSKNVHVIRPGVDPDYFDPGVCSRTALPMLVSVTRLVESKGLSDLVEACGILHSRRLRFRCAIVGDGPVRDQLRSLIDHKQLAEYVTLEGELDSSEIIKMLCRAWVFVLPCVRVFNGQGDHPARFVSTVEDGIPSSLVEAMSMGLPVVTTDVGAILELVEDGITGLVVREHDPDALAAALARLMDNSPLRERMGKASRGRVISEFDSMACARRLGELMHMAISQRQTV